MNNIAQRFKAAHKSVVQLTGIAQNMLDIGVYDREEHMSMTVLVHSLSRAMKILDPEKYSDYLDDLAVAHDEAVAEFQKEHGSGDDDDPGYRPGQYL